MGRKGTKRKERERETPSHIHILERRERKKYKAREGEITNGMRKTTRDR